MKRNASIFIIALTLYYSPAIAQSKWSVGFQGGRSEILGHTGGSFKSLDNLKAAGLGGVNFQLYGKYNLTNRLSLYAGGGINNLVPGIRFEGRKSRFSQNKGVRTQYFIGTEYDLNFGNSGFGMLTRLSFAIMGNNGLEKGYSVENSEGAQFLGWIHSDPLNNGQFEDRILYLKNAEFINSTSEFLMHLRPEIGFYKNIGKHRLIISGMYAFPLERGYGYGYRYENYLDLTYKGERHSAFHSFSGDYWAILAGYEFRF